jgi:hypothetical protein
MILICRSAFKWGTNVSNQERRFELRGRVHIPGLTDDERVRLCDSGSLLAAETEAEADELVFQLRHLSFPSDGFDEMSLDLIEKPQAPKMARVNPITTPPAAPIRASELSELGRLLRFSQATKPKQK